MPAKEQKQRNDQKVSSSLLARPLVKNAAKSQEQSQPAAIVQRARFIPESLTPDDIVPLQHTIGNRGMGWLLTGRVNVSQPVPQQVVPRKKVPTDFGEFETTQFTEAEGRGVEITLKFHPDESKVDAKKIALSQSVRTTLSNGAAYANDPNRAGRMVESGKPGAGYYIDRILSYNNPIYGAENLGATKKLEDTPQSGGMLACLTLMN
jgi:hypothetical protein